MQTKEVKAFGTQAADKQLEQLTITRRTVAPHDVEIEILYCGICHSDLHSVRDEWGNTTYPVVPGHEIVGKITRLGSHVTKFNIGDLAAVGCI
ncbi:MAG: alcohol dehydrogenase catalytic domain-containing protein, partial [Prevotellaceae bacterium]|nr:alcohol dehydrogenase catalytic domain-containing protein [Prevotellaceae bacterium]